MTTTPAPAAPRAMKPLPLREREYRAGLLRAERKFILPIKWLVLLVTVGLWFVVNHFGNDPLILPGAVPRPLELPPDWRISRPTLILFSIYGLMNLIESLLLYTGRIGPRHIRIVTLISYLSDCVYVTTLVYFSTLNFYWIGKYYSDFYILYFLLVMRGFALFTTIGEIALVNLLISVLFTFMIRMQQYSYAFVMEPAFIVRLTLIWLVLLMAWFIMVALNEQKNTLIGMHESVTRAENLARIGALAAGVAHEVNNPLGIIAASAEYLKKITPADDPRLEDIESIHAETNRCKEIVQQLLAYANPKPGEMAVIEPAAINDDVVNFVFPRGRAGKVEVVKEYAPHTPVFQADPNLLKQALLNIYINARQSIPEGREGRIVARILPRRGHRGVVFEIEDNGIGITPEDLERVFDPFFTRKATGTGLGLPMTQRIVESFRGQISVQPGKERGTLVRIEFPEWRQARL